MLRTVMASAFVMALVSSASATGLATCNSGPRSGWKPEANLRAQLAERGWQVRRIKEDGGCYEVYAIDERGRRVEAYFHPVTFANVLTSAR